MHDSTTASGKIIVVCRFIQHDQWFTTHVDPQWTIRQLKIWLVHRLFDINIPAKTFTTPSQRQPERPPSPITFAPDPRNRPASPIIFATPQKSGLYDPGRTATSGVLRGILSDTDEDLLSDSESGFSSASKRKGKGHRNEIRIETGPPSPGNITPGGRIGPSLARDSRMPMLPGHAITTSAGYTAPDADRFPGGINPYHWTLTRYSTGQIFGDDDQLSWYDLVEFELIELHGLSFPSTHPLYEYQVCHLWNQDRHRERERLRKKLKKRFETEAARDAKGREKNKGRLGRSSEAGARCAALHAQILRAMNHNSGAGAHVGVVEYYGSKLASTEVELTLTRIPRSIDTYIQPYWEGWVRTLRIVWRGNWDDIALDNISSSHFTTLAPHHPNSGIMGVAALGGNGPEVDPYKYGVTTSGQMLEGMYHGPIGTSTAPVGAVGDRDSESAWRTQKIIRLEWRERWVRIQSGTLAVLKDREDEHTTYVLPLKSLRSIYNTQHLARYLSCTGFNPPQDHPSVNPDILMPALNLPIRRPSLPIGHSPHSTRFHSHTSKSKISSSSTTYNPYPDSEGSDSLRHRHYSRSRHRHHAGHQPCNFNFPSHQHLIAHVKARELTPLVGSRFDPTYLPITTEEQKASGLRVVCLQFRKHSSIGLSSPSATAAAAAGLSSSYHPPKGHDGVLTQHERGGKGGSGDEEHMITPEKEPDVDPITLVLEDMKERSDEWGGIRSNNILWKCPGRLRREPLYLSRARARIAKLRSLGFSEPQIARGAAGGLTSSSIVSNTTIRRLNDVTYSTYRDSQGHSSRTGGGGRISPNLQRNVYKERYHGREQRQYRSADSDLYSIFASQVFSSPGSGKHFQENVEEKEREKREKELVKERAKQEKKEKGKGKEKEKDVVIGGRRKDEKDWNLGSFNVGFWNWKKKKREKKERERLRMQWDRQQEVDFSLSNNNSTAASSIPTSSGVPSSSLSHLHSHIQGQRLFASSATSVGTGISANTVIGSSNPTASSMTITGGGSRGVGVHPIEDDDDDEHTESTQYRISEPAGAISTEEEEEEEEADDGDVDVGVDDLDENVVESYPDTIPEHRPLEEDGSELIETSVLNPSQENDGDPNFVFQIKINKHVETKLSYGTEKHTPNTVMFGGRSIIPSSLKTSLPVQFPPSPTMTKQISTDIINVQRADSGMNTGNRQALRSRDQIMTKRQNQRLIGQLHSSGEGEGPDHESEEESSSPVFAPPPHSRRRTKSLVPYPTNPTSNSSRGSYDSIGGAATESYNFDDDLESEDEFLKHTKRAGYRYGSCDTKRDEDRKRTVEQMEEGRERRTKGLKEMGTKERMEKEREREIKKKEEEGEWVCLDIGNDYGFQSFLRIVHRDCPHPIKSTFLDRMAGGPLIDIPPPPQNLPQPLIVDANAGPTGNSIQPGNTSVQSQDIESVLHKDVTGSHSFSNSSAPSSSDRQTSSRILGMSPAPQTSTSPTVPRASSTPHGDSFPLEGDPSKADNQVTAERVTSLPGYGDPRFVYPSRTFATPPYPEWRVNVMQKAQHAGMGHVGKAMEFINWGRDDPVITGASGAVSDLEKMGRLWGSKPGLPGTTEKGKKEKRRESGLSDNVSSLGTIGPRTTRSGGAVEDVHSSPKAQRKGLSLRNAGSVKGADNRKGREESRNEGLAEAKDTSLADVGTTSKSLRFNATSDMADRSSDWNDEEEEYTSEMEWTAWHIDLPRQSKRQQAIETRRKVKAMSGVSGESYLDIPVDPADDMKRHLKKLSEMEPRAEIAREARLFPNPLSARSVGYSSTATSSPSRFTSDIPSPRLHDVPSQRHPILHHSASLHTGLRKGAQESPLRRPSMPILTQEKDKGKGKERSFWNIASFSAPSDEIKSPTTANSSWFSRKETREKEMVSPILQSTVAGGIVGKSGSVLLKGGLLRKKDSGDVSRERERERSRMIENEKELKKGQRPQLRVATSSSAVLSSNPVEFSKSAQQVKNPAITSGRLVRKMKSDVNILSIRANDFVPEVPLLRQAKKKKGTGKR